MSRTSIVRSTLALGFTALTLSGCGQQTTAGDQPATSAPSSSSPATSAPASSSPASSTSSTASTPPNTTGATSATAANSASPTVAPTKQADPARYKTTAGVGSGYYFTAADGKLRCAIADTMTGCQAVVVVPTMPQCDNPDTNAPIGMIESGSAETDCTTQGLFITEKLQPALPDGSALTIGHTSCEVHAETVICTQGSAVLTMSPKSFTAQ